MADRAHIRFVNPDWTLVRKYNGEKGRYTLEGGGTVSPVVIGDENGNDKIVPIERPSTDTSTGPDIVRTVVETIEATRVLRTETIRDMTQQEIDDRGTANLNSFYRELNDNPSLAGFRDVVFRLQNSVRVLEGKSAWTKGQFNDHLKDRIQDQIDTL